MSPCYTLKTLAPRRAVYNKLWLGDATQPKHKWLRRQWQGRNHQLVGRGSCNSGGNPLYTLELVPNGRYPCGVLAVPSALMHTHNSSFVALSLCSAVPLQLWHPLTTTHSSYLV